MAAHRVDAVRRRVVLHADGPRGAAGPWGRCAGGAQRRAAAQRLHLDARRQAHRGRRAGRRAGCPRAGHRGRCRCATAGWCSPRGAAARPSSLRCTRPASRRRPTTGTPPRSAQPTSPRPCSRTVSATTQPRWTLPSARAWPTTCRSRTPPCPTSWRRRAAPTSRGRAIEATEALSAWADASGTEWALGSAARCRALVSTAPEAEEHYREAIERLGRCRSSWTSRAPTSCTASGCAVKAVARTPGRQLRTAHRLLSEMGAAAFAARAARELRATGEHARARTALQADELTAHELQVARLVATGATSREVAAQLFLSPRTIEAHLAASSGSWGSRPGGSSGSCPSPDDTR